MNASKRSALKLVLILALGCLYTFVGFADSSTPAPQPQPTEDISAAAATAATIAQGSAPCDPKAPRTKLYGMTAAEAACRSIGCMDCHTGVEDIHNGKANLGCIDCHGGHAEVRSGGAQKGSKQYEDAKLQAHVQPRNPASWARAQNPKRAYGADEESSKKRGESANPIRSYAMLNRESWK